MLTVFEKYDLKSKTLSNVLFYLLNLRDFKYRCLLYTRYNNAYIEVVTVDGTAHSPFLLWWQLLLGKLEHQRLSTHLISTAKKGEKKSATTKNWQHRTNTF